MTADMEIGILNIEPTYLSDQNFYYHEHIHGVTESQWAFTGALRCIGGNGSLQSVTPLPTDPVYKSWNADVPALENFDRLIIMTKGKCRDSCCGRDAGGAALLYFDRRR